MVLFCRQNCEAHERRLVNGNGIDVECRDSLKPTATLTASSSNFNPHEAMGSANSQSPLCWQEAAKNDARRCAEARLASTLALDSSTPGRSQMAV